MTQKNNLTRNEFLEQCEVLAKNPDITHIFKESLRTLGFVGDTCIPVTIWLATFTGKNREMGKTDRPVSVLIKGPSGGGKSFSLNSALKFVPPEAYESFSGMSEKAIVYMEDKDLRHKHLVIGEAAGMASGNGRAFLRQLISEGEIKYATVSKDASGQLRTQEMHIDGPTGVFMTTTANRIHHEDENRMLSMNVVETREQRLATLMEKAGGLGEPSVDINPIDFDMWHAFHRYITSGSQEVKIPYAPRIVAHLPLHHDRIKRDFNQIYSLLKACALVHQFSRDKDEEGQLISNKMDYEIIYNLLNEPLAENLAVSTPQAIREVVEAVGTLSSTEMTKLPGVSCSVTLAQIAGYLDRDRSAVSRSVAKAVELEYLTDDNPGKGKTSQLHLGQVALPSGTVLPHPDELFKDTSVATSRLIEAAE